MDNTPEMAFQLGSAGLGGHVAVGLNTTRRGEALLADIRKADCQVVVADPRLVPLLDGLDLGGVRVVRQRRPRTGSGAGRRRPGRRPERRHPSPDSLFMLIFTSGTSGDPKAVRITHEKVAYPGAYLVERSGSAPTTSLRVDAAVPLQRGDGRLGAGAGLRRRDRRAGREVLREPASSPTYAATARRT